MGVVKVAYIVPSDGTSNPLHKSLALQALYRTQRFYGEQFGVTFEIDDTVEEINSARNRAHFESGDSTGPIFGLTDGNVTELGRQCLNEYIDVTSRTTVDNTESLVAVHYSELVKFGSVQGFATSLDVDANYGMCFITSQKFVAPEEAVAEGPSSYQNKRFTNWDGAAGTIAHELGHVMGLPHKDNDGLMDNTTSGPGVRLSETYLDAAEKAAIQAEPDMWAYFTKPFGPSTLTGVTTLPAVTAIS